MSGVWEDAITLNSRVEPIFSPLAPAADHLEHDFRKADWAYLNYDDALSRDRMPLPRTEDREGYYGEDHFSYWASGLRDKAHLLEAAERYDAPVRRYLDIGCASGRVIRHFAAQHWDIETLGCDINRLHVEWCNTFLQGRCMVFQNHSIPTLPIEDASVDLISAFSVFTHIESLETAWLMELRRILRPGGLVWLTAHTEKTLEAMTPDWPLWAPVINHPNGGEEIKSRRDFDGNRLLMRWHDNASYSSNVFYRTSYFEAMIGKFFEVVDIRHAFPEYQDVFIARRKL